MRILYLIRRISGDRTGFRNEIVDYVRKEFPTLADGIVVTVSDIKPPPFSVIPFRRDLVALVSLEGVDDKAVWPAPPEGFAGAYAAEAAWPVIHERDWELGERSPGVGLFTMFRQKKGLSQKEFLRRWYEGHTPLTLDVHPNAGYVRNRVAAVWPAAGNTGDKGHNVPEWDGIVEEQYDPAENLLKARRFFGGSLWKMLPTMLRVYRDVKGFIDYPSIHTWLTSEYRIR